MEIEEIEILSSSSSNAGDCEPIEKKPKTEPVEEEDEVEVVEEGGAQGGWEFIEYDTLLPSLEEVSMSSVVIKLWHLPDSVNELHKYVRNQHVSTTCENFDEAFHDLEQFVSKKVLLLPLPEILKQEMMNFVRPIGIQLVKWLKNEAYPLMCRERLDYITWSPDGIIDKLQTFYNMEVIVDEEVERNVIAMFRLACTFCSEESVLCFWDKLPDQFKKQLTEEDAYRLYEDHLVQYWVCFCTDDLDNFMPRILKNNRWNFYYNDVGINVNMLKLAIKERNKLAAAYFWDRLTDDELLDNVMAFFKYILDNVQDNQRRLFRDVDENMSVVCSLLSRCWDIRAQKMVILCYGEDLLEHLFLSWPCEKFFMCTLRALWRQDCHVSKFYFGIRPMAYNKLLICISEQVKEGRTVEKLVQKIWQETPSDFRKDFIQYITRDQKSVRFFYPFLVVKAFDVLKLIFKDATDDQKKLIIKHSIPSDWVIDLIRSDRLHLLDFFISEASFPKYSAACIKKDIAGLHAAGMCLYFARQNNWVVLDKVVNWLFDSRRKVKRYKKKKLYRSNVIGALLSLGCVDSLHKFMNWCFSSENEVARVKKRLLAKLSQAKIMSLCSLDWKAFQSFLVWMSELEKEISEFKDRASKRPGPPKIVVRGAPDDPAGYSATRRRFMVQFEEWCK